MNDGLTKYQRYGRSAKGRARDLRRAGTEVRLASQSRYDWSTKGMTRRTCAELAHAQRSALESQV